MSGKTIEIGKGTAQSVGMRKKDAEVGTEETGWDQEHEEVEVSQDSPFIIKMRLRTKKKVDKSKGVVLLIVTDGDIDEIAEKVQEVNAETWNKIDDCCKAMEEVQQGFAELKAFPQALARLEHVT